MDLMINAATTLATQWHDHDGPGWWIVFVPLFWIAVITTVIVLLRRFGLRWPRRETALDVLERRYAQGDIDADEYRERRSVLGE